MYVRKYVIQTLVDVKKLVEITMSFKEKIYITQNEYNVDGKSIMGILSLDLTKPVIIKIITEDQDVANDFFAKVTWICEVG